MLRALAGALLKSVRRDLAGYGSFKTNNFFLFIVLLIWGALRSGVEPVSSYPFLLILGLLMLFPASGDPLEKIPGPRMGLWPLGRADRMTLRAASVVLSPLFWLAAVVAWVKAGLWLVVALAALAMVRKRVAKAGARRQAMFRAPSLVAKNIREMFQVLDTYLALGIGVAGGLWRLFGKQADAAAFPILALLAAMALSTYAQCLFALEGASGATRDRLLPLRGWRIVLAKDAAFCAILLAAVLPLGVVPGLTFGLTSLAVARYPALRLPMPQQRWRFTSGRVFWGVIQSIAGAVLGFAGRLEIAVVVYAISLWWAGREYDRRPG